MSSKTPDRGPHHADDTGGDKVILVEFTLQAMPGDQDPLKGERKGRPTRSPSLPPEEPKPDENPPAAT